MNIQKKYEMMVEDIGYFFNSYSYEFDAYLDLDNWNVVPCSSSCGEQAHFYPEEGHRILRIEQLPSVDNYNAMRDFVDIVEDEPTREKLTKALANAHPFRRFKTLVLNDNLLRPLWYNHLHKVQRNQALHWLDEHQVTLDGERLVSPQAFEFRFTDFFCDDLIDNELFNHDDEDDEFSDF